METGFRVYGWKLGWYSCGQCLKSMKYTYYVEDLIYGLSSQQEGKPELLVAARSRIVFFLKEWMPRVTEP